MHQMKISSLHILIFQYVIVTYSPLLTISMETDRIDQQEPDKSPVQRIFDPHLSWLAFVKNSNRATNRHRIKSGGGVKKEETLPIPPAAGPQGPQGPPGPPGPPGANVTKEILIHEFRELVKEVAEKRMQLYLSPKQKVKSSELDDKDVLQSHGAYLPPLFDLDNVVILPKVAAGFFSRISEPVIVQRKSLCEVKELHVPFGDGAFRRSDENTSFLKDGRYVISKTGIYQIFVNLHFRLKKKKIDKTKGALHALVCIDLLCHTNVALESVLSAEQLGQYFSLSVAGILQLQEAQFISIMIDNDTRNTLTLQTNSYFSVALNGL